MTNHRTNNVLYKGVYENLSIHVIGRISYGLLNMPPNSCNLRISLFIVRDVLD